MKLHLGCGNNYREGFVNLDVGNCKVDVCHNLNETPYPFEDNQFSLIMANQVLEHLCPEKWLEIMCELHRISKPNAIWEFRSPYAISDNFATDPTHKMALTQRSFDYFDRRKPLGVNGMIYGFPIELHVLKGELINTDKYGPDVYHTLLVVKENIERTCVPEQLPNFLHKPEPFVKTLARKVVKSIF